MHYTPNTALAFSSVEHIMRDVNNGWLIRYIHANGASFFFILVYLHIGRNLFYGSYRSPRGLLWSIGVIIFIMMMATWSTWLEITPTIYTAVPYFSLISFGTARIIATNRIGPHDFDVLGVIIWS